MDELHIDDYDNEDIKALKYAQNENLVRKYIISLPDEKTEKLVPFDSYIYKVLLDNESPPEIIEVFEKIRDVANTSNMSDLDIAVEYYEIIVNNLMMSTVDILTDRFDQEDFKDKLHDELIENYDKYAETYLSLEKDIFITNLKKSFNMKNNFDETDAPELLEYLRDYYIDIESVIEYGLNYSDIEVLEHKFKILKSGLNIENYKITEKILAIKLDKEVQDIIDKIAKSKKPMNDKSAFILKYDKENPSISNILRQWKSGNFNIIFDHIKLYSLERLQNIAYTYRLLEEPFFNIEAFLADKEVKKFSDDFVWFAIYGSLIKVERDPIIQNVIEEINDDDIFEEEYEEDIEFQTKIFSSEKKERKILTILDRVNFINSGSIESGFFSSYKAIENQYDNTLGKLETIYDRETKMLQNIELLQDDILRSELYHNSLCEKNEPTEICELDMSDYEIKSTNQILYPYMDGKKVQVDDGEKIFSNCEAIEEIPYVSYISSNGRVASKIYKGKPLQNFPEYEKLIINHKKYNTPNFIYLHLWKELMIKKNSKLSNVDIKSLIILKFDLTKGELELISPTDKNINYEPRVFLLISKVFPMLDFSKKRISHINGIFYLWKFNFDEDIFLHMLLKDPHLSNYLFLSESGRDISSKTTKSLPIYMKTSTFNNLTKKNNRALYFTMFRNHIINSTKVSVTHHLPDRLRNGKTVLKVLPDNSKFFTIKFSAYSKRQISNFIFIFHGLLSYFFHRTAPIYSLYNAIRENETISDILNHDIPYTESKNVDDFRIIKKDENKQNITEEKIYTEADAVLVKDFPYDRMNEVDFIHEDEIFTLDGREYMFYPSKVIYERLIKENKSKGITTKPRKIYTSSRDDILYMGVVKNHYSKNKYDRYKPRAFCNKQRNTKIFSDYTKKDNEKNVSEKIKNTENYIPPNIYATVADELEEILKIYHIGLPKSIKRIGMPYSNASILHCILYAKNVSDYIKLDPFGKEKMIRKERYKLYLSLKNAEVNISILSQQMWDFDNLEIVNMLINNDEYLDPALFYALLEEYYDINIYWFIQPNFDKGEGSTTFGLPRFKSFLSRQYINRESILVMVADGDRDKEKQCELILFGDNPIMDPVENESFNLCHKLLAAVNENILWSGEVNNKSLIGYRNIFYKNDIRSFFTQSPVNGKLVSQHIDDYGKMRGINILMNKKYITVLTIPLAPLNLPKTSKVHYADHEYIISIFGEPSKKSIDLNGETNALWYTAWGVTEFFQIPVKDCQVNVETGNPLTVVDIKRETVNRLISLDKTHRLIKELFLLAFSLFYKDSDLLDVFYFMKNYTKVSTRKNIDSVFFYDFSKLERKLPEIQHLDDLLSYLNTTVNTLVNEGYFIFYSEKYRDKMKDLLFEYGRLIEGDNIEIPTYISSYYMSSEDYAKSKKNFTFYDKDELDKWLQNVSITKTYDNNFIINDIFNKDIVNSKNGYIFKARGDKYYLIQNTLTGFNAALYISYMWSTKRVNPGIFISMSDINTVNLDDIPYIVYCVSSDMNIEPAKDMSNGSINYLSVLYYGSLSEYLNVVNKDYAALLPIN